MAVAFQCDHCKEFGPVQEQVVMIATDLDSMYTLRVSATLQVGSSTFAKPEPVDLCDRCVEELIVQRHETRKRLAAATVVVPDGLSAEDPDQAGEPGDDVPF